jgi:hypothetical protein
MELARVHGVIALLLAFAQFTDPGDTRPGGVQRDFTLPVAPIVAHHDLAAARPRVVVYSSPNCPACTRFAGWLAANGETSFFAFEYGKTPAWVQSVPAFHWQANSGEWKVVYGWTGIDGFRRAWESGQVAAETVASRKTAAAERLPDTLRRFAGQRGTIVFRPDSPVSPEITDGVTLDIREVKARYDLTGAEPRITFENPQPTGTVSKWGVGVGYRLLDAVYSERQNEVRVGTNWKTVRFILDD